MADTSSNGSSGGKPDRRLDSRQILTIVAVILLVWFAVSNWQSVPIHFWVTTSKAPLFIMIVLAAVLGALVMNFARRRRSKKAPED